MEGIYGPVLHKSNFATIPRVLHKVKASGPPALRLMPLPAEEDDDLYGSPVSLAKADSGDQHQVVSPEEQAQTILALEQESWPHRSGDPMALISSECASALAIVHHLDLHGVGPTGLPQLSFW